MTFANLPYSPDTRWKNDIAAVSGFAKIAFLRQNPFACQDYLASIASISACNSANISLKKGNITPSELINQGPNGEKKG